MTGNLFNSIQKLTRIKSELEESLTKVESQDPEAGSDLRWGIILLARSLMGLEAARKPKE